MFTQTDFNTYVVVTKHFEERAQEVLRKWLVKPEIPDSASKSTLHPSQWSFKRLSDSKTQLFYRHKDGVGYLYIPIECLWDESLMDDEVGRK